MQTPQISPIFQNLEFEAFGLTFAPSYLQAAAIVALLFLLLFTLARLRKLYVKWSTTGGQAWIFIGFLLALILEGFLVISGRTVVTELLGWKNPPKPVAVVLDAGRNKLVDVLGVSEAIPESYASGELDATAIYNLYSNLPEEEKVKLQDSVCASNE